MQWWKGGSTLATSLRWCRVNQVVVMGWPGGEGRWKASEGCGG